MIGNNMVTREERMSTIINELHKANNMERKIELLVNHLYSKIINTHKCYRIALFELPAHNVIDEEEFPQFKQILVSRLKEKSLRVEEEEQDLIKVECSKKIKAEELPALSPLQSKVVELYKIRDDADEIAKQLVEKQELTQQEYEELQLVRNYEF